MRNESCCTESATERQYLNMIEPVPTGYQLRPGTGLLTIHQPDGSVNMLTDIRSLYNDGYLQTTAETTWQFQFAWERGDIQAILIGEELGNNNQQLVFQYPIPKGCFTFSIDLKGALGSKFEMFALDDQGNEVQTKTVCATGEWQRNGVAVTFYNDTVDGNNWLFGIRLTQPATAQQWLVARPQLEPKPYQTSWMGEDVDRWYPGCSGLYKENGLWNRTEWSNAGGRLIQLDCCGFRTVGLRGFGLPQRQHVTSPFTIRNGTNHQRSRWKHREFSVIGNFTAKNLTDLFIQRGEVERLFIPLRSYDESPLVMTYQHYSMGGCPLGREIEITYRYAAGLEGNINSDFGEMIELRMVSDDPFWSEPGEGYHFESYAILPTKRPIFRVINTGDMPAPAMIEVRGSGEISFIHNLTNNQRIDFKKPIPLDPVKWLKFIPEDVNIKEKMAYWNEDGSFDKSQLVDLKLGGSLPVFELMPSRCHRVGENKIHLGLTIPSAGEVKIRWKKRWAGVEGSVTDWTQGCNC